MLTVAIQPIMLNVIMLCAFLLSATILTVIMLRAFLLGGVVLNVVMLNAIMPNVIAVKTSIVMLITIYAICCD